MQTIRIMIVDDHPTVRFGLQAVMSEIEGFMIIGVAENGKEAIALCCKKQPDVVLIDLYMPTMNGFEAMRVIRSKHPSIKFLVLTHDEGTNAQLKAIEAGADGFLIKKAEIELIAEAIRQTHNGTNKLVAHNFNQEKSQITNQIDIELTSREHDVLQLMANGMKNTQIARELTISLPTVKSHISAIFKKLQVNTRTEAVIFAMQIGLIDDINNDS